MLGSQITWYWISNAEAIASFGISGDISMITYQAINDLTNLSKIDNISTSGTAQSAYNICSQTTSSLLCHRLSYWLQTMTKLALICVGLLVLVFAGPSYGFLRKIYPSTHLANEFLEEQYADEDATGSDALYLTPYIESGKLAEGRNLSEVHNLPGGAPKEIKSFSGYFTVDKNYNSNIFFWFFPALVRFFKNQNCIFNIIK